MLDTRRTGSGPPRFSRSRLRSSASLLKLRLVTGGLLRSPLSDPRSSRRSKRSAPWSGRSKRSRLELDLWGWSGGGCYIQGVSEGILLSAGGGGTDLWATLRSASGAGAGPEADCSAEKRLRVLVAGRPDSEAGGGLQCHIRTASWTHLAMQSQGVSTTYRLHCWALTLIPRCCPCPNCPRCPCPQGQEAGY